MKTRRRRIEKLKRKEFNAFSMKVIEYYIYATGALIKEFCIALAKVFSRMAEMMRELLEKKKEESE